MRLLPGCLLGTLLLAGPFGCDSGPTRYRYTGAVLLDGKPVPEGMVVFTPDGSLKNSGPQGVADIHDGKYDTGEQGGKGLAGGPTVIRVVGLAGGKPLCEEEIKADLPRASSTYDINVKKSTTAPPQPVKEI